MKHTTIFSVHWNLPIEEAARLMEAKSIRHLPVRNGEGIYIGILSDRDVKHAVDPKGMPLREGLTVGDFVKWPVFTVSPHDSVEGVATMMMEKKISSVLVGKGEEITGIITSEDLLCLLRKMLQENNASLTVASLKA